MRSRKACPERSRRAPCTLNRRHRAKRHSSRRLSHICSLRSLGALHYLELDYIVFLQTLVAFGSDRAVVDENVRTIIAAKKAVSLGVVKPLYDAF
jgi:hypothetical protein